MANNNNDGSDSSKESGLDKSFVVKFVSGLLHNTPLSKWFGKEPSKSVIRRREDDDDYEDASNIFQPPVKRTKVPEHNNYSGAHLFESPVTVHNNASNNIVNNNISSARVFGNKLPEPMAGPLGIKSRKLFETHNSTASTNTVSSSFDCQNVLNSENDSNSEESASGCCTAPKLDKDKVCEKSTPKTRSLFASTDDFNTSRSLLTERSPQLNTSLSSRRPAFNASTFGSPSFVDRTLSTKKILNSPFYNGHTIYGGASAYGRRLGRSAKDLNNSLRASVQIVPIVNEKTNDNTTLSKTARRILSTLERYSTPISDAKKIPVTLKRQGILSKYIGASPYSTAKKPRPLNNEFQVPSIPELLQMKQKEKLQKTQKSTVSVRQIATTSKSILNKQEYKLRTEDDSKQKSEPKLKNNGENVKSPIKTTTWECSMCWIRNDSDKVKCAACNEPKPTPVKTTTPMFNFGIPEWECKLCLVKNKKDLTKCASCGSLKETTTKGFGDVFKIKEGEWECTSCMVRNKPGSDTCCGVSKEKKTVLNLLGLDKSSPMLFKFGIPKSEPSKESTSTTITTSVSLVTSTTMTPVAASVLISSSSAPGGFVFGDAKPTTTTTSGFTFGITQEKVSKSITSTTKTNSGSNPLLKPNEKLPEKAVPAPVSFKFGVDKSNCENLITSTSNKTEPTPVMFSTSSSSFQSPIPTAENLFASKPPETGLFSAPPAFKFSVKPTTTMENANTNPAVNPEVSAWPIFKFGAPDSTSMKKFGETTNDQVSGFGAKPFGSTVRPPPAQPLFGTTATTTTENKPFSFEAPAATDPTKNTTFSFGQQTLQPEKPQNMPVFNFGAAATATNSTPGFNFSSPPQPSSGFNFGAPTAPSVVAAPPGANNGSFNFGTNSNNYNQNAIFTFGASQTNPPPQPSFPTQTPGFSFGAVAPFSVLTGGFNFTGAPPSFNFTDGTQSSTAPSQRKNRKFKKTLRRTHR